MTDGPAVDVDGLAVRYEGFALGPLDFRVRAGERVALVGPNGAGKTTTLGVLAGRSPRYEGRARVVGFEARDAPVSLRARVGVLGEELLGFGWMTVSEHLALLGDVHPHWDDGWARALVARLEIPPATRLAALSRGNRVKLGLVGAEAFRPPLLLLDEPTSGIDPLMRTALLGLLDEIAPAGGERAVVFSTHILEDVERVADRVLLLRDGALVLDAPIRELRDRHAGRPLPDVLLAELARA